MVGYVDQFMISHYSQNSVAAVGNGNQVISILTIVINLMSIASCILISQELGRKNREKIIEIYNVMLGMVIAVCLVISVALIVFSKQLFTLMSVPDEIMGETRIYFIIVIAFLTVQGMYMVFAAVLRSHTLVRYVMYLSVLMNLLNTAGNVLLINGYGGLPRLGIIGAAVSTVISKTIGMLLMFYTVHKKLGYPLSVRYLYPLPVNTIKRLLAIGIPPCAEEFNYSLSQLVIMKFINFYGTAVINTKIYCYMIANTSYIYTVALSQATQIAIGHLVGSGKGEQIGKRIKNTTLISICVSLAFMLIVFFNSDFIFGLFTDNREIWQMGHDVLKVDIFLEICRSVNLVMSRCLVALNDAVYPVVMGAWIIWIASVVGGYLLGVHLKMALIGIWLAMLLDEFGRGIVFVRRFRSGRWRRALTAS